MEEEELEYWQFLSRSFDTEHSINPDCVASEDPGGGGGQQVQTYLQMLHASSLQQL